ncbi:MAG: type IV pili twitching motility protein PilT, partial [Alphaproteobacteria bacterium]
MTLNTLMDELAQERGSDLHLVVGEPPIFRVGGALIRRPDGPILNNEEMESLLLPHLTATLNASLQQGNDVEKSLRLDKNRFKMTVFHERGNLAASIRVIPTHVPTMTELSFTREEHVTLYKLIDLKRGLVIVSGPTGSGKSTTIAAMIEEINQQRAERI